MSNKVLHSFAKVSFTTSSGYESTEHWGDGITLNDTQALKAALREIGRVLTINGEGDEAVAIIAEVKAAVEKDLKGE